MRMFCQQNVKSDSIDFVCKKSFTDFFIGSDSATDAIRNGKILIPLDKLLKDGELFCTVKSKLQIKILFDDRDLLLFDLNERGDIVAGRYFYLNSGYTAIFGEFKNNRLHGKVFTFDYDGNLDGVLVYKKGMFKRYNYLHGKVDKKYLRFKTKRMSGDPILGDQLITIY